MDGGGQLRGDMGLTIAKMMAELKATSPLQVIVAELKTVVVNPVFQAVIVGGRREPIISYFEFMEEHQGALQECESKKEGMIPFSVLFKDIRYVFKTDELGQEIMQIALPAALALAADPIASLIDTAFIGHLGPVELAAVGVSIAIFNQASRITIFPLVSITTSFVAEEDTFVKMTPEDEDKDKTVQAMEMNHRRHIPSASTSIIIGMFLGLLQTFFLVMGAKILLSAMGVDSDSPMLKPAHKYLTLRSLGSPAVLLSLAMQAVFRGLRDTRTPLYATVVGDLSNIILDPILIFVCHMGVSGAAIAHVISQYLMCCILLWRLMKKVDLVPPTIKALHFKRFLKNGFLLLARVIAVTSCVTLAASMAGRLGSTPMASFQICLQVWMTSSLLADGLAVAGQAILASAFAEQNHDKATAAACRVLQMGFILGLGLALLVGLGLTFGSTIFTKDVQVLRLITIGIPIVVAVVTIASLMILSKSNGFVGIWIALTIYMVLRAMAGVWRIGTGTGPWRFLRFND
uniref:Protein DETOXIFICATION n=1 Tax=Fagopyrum esculentum TaxID=3617 RepID=A0A346KIX7_FAGES|nr:citrate transporter [Fagopyrum esculentum]